MFLYQGCLEIDAVCANPKRKYRKFKAPPNDLWEVSHMYVNVPGQYTIVISVKPKQSKYKHTYVKELGVMHPINNDKSEDSYYLQDNPNELVQTDPNYDVK